MSKAAELAALIGSQSALSNRNRIINGAMQVAQRGTSTSSVSSGFTYPAVDRLGFNVNNGGTWTVSQSTDTPSGQGFGNSFKLDCTSADTSLGAADFIQAKMRLEANTLQSLAYNTSSAKSTTLSFWVKSAKTGTYIVEWLNEDASNKHIAKTYTIDSANTWEKKELTIPGDTAGAINNDTGKGMELTWWLGAGSNFTSSGSLQTSWGSLDQTSRAVGVVNLADSTSNDWYITGIQWEVGEQATPFEHRSFGDELRRCQRYYHRLDSANANGNYYRYNSQRNTGSTGTAGSYHMPVTMRSTPSISTTGTASNYAITHTGGNTACSSTPAIGGDGSGPELVNLEVNVASGLTSGQGSQLMSNNNKTSFIAFDAEI